MFWPPNFWGDGPEFLESIYKIDTGSDHAAKFRRDRPRDLRDYALKEKRNITSKIEDLPYYRTGGLKSVAPAYGYKRSTSRSRRPIL